jgi:hypothetical protein
MHVKTNIKAGLIMPLHRGPGVKSRHRDPRGGCPSQASARSTGRRPAPCASALRFPGGIEVEATGTLVVVGGVLDAVLRVDPLTGDRTVVSR